MIDPLDVAAKEACDIQQPDGAWERGSTAYQGIFRLEAMYIITAYLKAAADDDETGIQLPDADGQNNGLHA